MLDKLDTTVAFLMKEVIIPSLLLGNTDFNVRINAHGEGYYNEDWGGILVVVLFEDDYQLVPPCEEGAIDSLYNVISLNLEDTKQMN